MRKRKARRKPRKSLPGRMKNNDPDKGVLTKTSRGVQIVLQIPEGQLTHEYEDYEALKKRIVPVIREMLDRDFSGLLNILYRIDVSENKLKQILSFGKPEHIAIDITDLILQREMQKVKTRQQYKSE